MQSIADGGTGLPEKPLSDATSRDNDHVIAVTTSGWKKIKREVQVSLDVPCLSAIVMARGIGVSIEDAIEWRNVLHVCGQE
ncbi:MAG: hypothetical protein ABL907_16130 [Hyphomicrobium sp.]